MMYEYLQGSNSRWKPYFDVLPRQFDTLMFWSEDELKELQSSAVLQKIGKPEADQGFRDEILPRIQVRHDFPRMPVPKDHRSDLNVTLDVLHYPSV